ncbi:NAD-dependent epimerase/dehydratase family protein [Flexivirga alba]|uniref:NAD-dependent epimerase/dehydratase family protein n=1 Tax=Flexivirga alba TaxID=702742 RepID=A0ABW2AFN4_9MICO
MSSIVQQSRSFAELDKAQGARVRRSVLVTGAAGVAGKSLAQQLIARGFQVHCFDTRPMDIPSATCHVADGMPGLMPALARLIRTEHIDLVIPANSVDLSAISSGRMAFGNRVDVVVAGPGPTATAQDRLMTAWALWSHGIGVPDFGVPSDFAHPTKSESIVSGALMLRSRWVDGDQPTVLVDHPSEVDWASVGDDLLVQEFVPGTTYKAVVYRPLDGKGRLTIVLEEAILDGGEIGAKYTIAQHTMPEVERVAQAAVRALGLTGPAEVSLRSREGGEPLVLDVRAGFGPHSSLAPELLEAVLRDHPSRETAPRVRDRINGAPVGGFSARDGRVFASGARR